MRHAEARAEIETRFAALWSASPVAFENVMFDPPADGTAWLRLAVVSDGVQLASIGGPPRRFRCHGHVVLDLHAPAGSGSRAAFELADAALDLFAGWPVSQLTFLPGSPEPAAAFGETYRVTVIVPFRHDDLR